MFTKCNIPTANVLTPDAFVNMAVSELKRLGQADAAEALSPCGLNWYNRPWRIENVIKWEAAILEALEIEGLSRFHKKGLNYVLSKVTDWLFDAVSAEEEEWRDYVRQTRWGSLSERD
jgi:hypothetical protein